MLIAQISDTHVRPRGQLYHGVADSNRMLAQAIAHLHGLDRRPDLVLLTGDVVDKGHPDEYAMARALLAELAMPCLVIPGNHDHREAFRTAFADHPWLPASGPLHYCVDTHPVRIVALDSTVPGAHHGAIDEAGLDWLRATLAADAAKPTIVLLHHPPFASGIPYMDAYRLLAPERLAQVIGGFRNIEAVLCGHVHRPMLRRWAGTVACACPSTTTEIALRLAPGARPASFMAPPACMLHLWDGVHGMVSHTSTIGSFEGPFDFA
ncbi:phosphodiesterase [Pseudorhodoferax sp. Leaf274]|uniref:phosphodiesterase n=1 Tax=Pseudorhodoferax sp. Leaf274 TaxID=1736318 RepID=UPI0007033ACB|nr:phosphodiesterase [Pseudorhodoferax sp. Leaf274]KQP43161.1 metallophosphatase [Pseudorhodoferax sp. Leaf274]